MTFVAIGALRVKNCTSNFCVNPCYAEQTNFMDYNVLHLSCESATFLL